MRHDLLFGHPPWSKLLARKAEASSPRKPPGTARAKLFVSFFSFEVSGKGVSRRAEPANQTTSMYTQVSIEQLKDVHAKTHPVETFHQDQKQDSKNDDKPLP